MKTRFVPYNKNLKQFSRDLRNNSILTEILLWKKLRNKQFRGYQFLRQKPIDRYIADFYCQQLQLVLELDGSSHHSPDAQENDAWRDTMLQDYGIHTLRIDDKQVMGNIAAVLNTIEEYIDMYELKQQAT